MRILRHSDPQFDRKAAAFFSRRAIASDEVRDVVANVLADVAKRGDKAVLELTKKFDKASLNATDLRITDAEISAAKKQATPDVRRAVAASKKNVTAFARQSLRKNWRMKNEQGATVGEIYQPFERVGVYVPGGSAPLVSTSLMTVGFAAAAKVPEIAVCTPCGPDGSINPNLLFALDAAGATEIYRIGGAQAIAALALGTKTIAPVAKIFGPGNSYVVEAKRQVFGIASIDLLPGPSEILVLADKTGNPDFIAADLLAQAEHGGDSVIGFLTDSKKLLNEVVKAVEAQSKTLTRQKQLLNVIKKNCVFTLVKSLEQGIELVNDFAPEHLTLITAREKEILPRITTSGAIFLGNQSPVAVGDFLAGPSHTLPTGGAGKSFPGLMADQFQRRTSIVKLTESAMKKSEPIVSTFAEIEGLDAHGRSASIRTE
ncbi:MAG: histidinol dehydrogenase [Verrucomicrobiota bacterium]